MDGATELFLNGDTLLARYLITGASRVEVYDRKPAGGWMLSSTIFFATGPNPLAFPLRVTTSGDIIAVIVQNGSLFGSTSTQIYRRTQDGALRLDAELGGVLTRLTPDYALLSFIGREIKVIPTAQLFGDIRVCTERGSVLCDGQRAGDLRFADLPVFGSVTPNELVLQEAPAGRAAFVVGSNMTMPSMGFLDSLCIGTSGTMVRLPEVMRISPSGTASWIIDPSSLPLGSGGTISGIGTQWVFQGIVRTQAGAATSRAVNVQL